LIGGNGFIGSHLLDCLLNKKYKVRVVDRSKELFRNSLPEVEYFYGDILDVGLLESAAEGCDIVIHLAHFLTSRDSINTFYDELFNNLNAFIGLLNVISKSSVEKIIYFSSGGTVYGQTQEITIPETHQLKPISSYGVVKVTMENYLHMYSHHHHKEYLVIRPANPYGPRQNFRYNQGVIPIFIYHILNNMPITIWGSGDNRKDYIYVKDVAKATLKLMQNGVKNQVFNIGSGVGISLLELVRLIEVVTRKQAIIEEQKSLNTDVLNFTLDCTKYQNLIGKKPASTKLIDGIKETHRWLCNEKFKKS
jgi:UDP-glucose 4-epimerase